MDVALNTLTSSGMVAASLATLSPAAHFVEISKRDIWSAARMAQGKMQLQCTATQWKSALCIFSQRSGTIILSRFSCLDIDQHGRRRAHFAFQLKAS